MDASKNMEELLKRIYMPSVFYFPKVLFPNLSPETVKELKEYHFFEDIGILKVNEDVSSLRNKINTLEIYKKDAILEANVFQLLEMRERLGSESFGFLLDKYLSNIKVWVTAYDWLLENFSKQFSETYLNEKALFKHQCNALNNHLTILNQKFIFNFKTTTSTSIIDILSKNKKAFPFDKSIYNNLKGSIKKVDDSKENKTTKQHKKQIILTDSEADEFLLKTVFNVNTTPF